MSMESTARLLITCPDRPGIVATVTGFLHSHGVNITALDQHATHAEGGTFFLRMEFQTPHMDLARPALENAFQKVVAEPFQMNWTIAYAAQKKRMAILVSRTDHCLLELLWRHARGELHCDIPMVLSNHETLRGAVEQFEIPFHHVPNGKDMREEAEEKMLELLTDAADMVVLARYMQIVTPTFIEPFKDRMINIHHSFLPAFVGANPYRQAYEKGVKLIGATAHYVTEDLDQGPIIEQNVARVSHRQSVTDLQELGRDLERTVLARAVRAHLDDRIIIDGTKTVVF